MNNEVQQNPSELRSELSHSPVAPVYHYGTAPVRGRAKVSGSFVSSPGTNCSPKRPVCGIYLRVSTEKQADSGDSLHVQRLRCIAHLEETFGPGVFEYAVFEDAGCSGSHGPLPNEVEPEVPFRPELARLLNSIRKGDVTHVVALSSDRLYRDVVGMPLLRRLLGKCGVKLLLVLDQQEDTLAGELSGNVLSSVNDFARKQVRQRSKLVLDQRRDEGYWLGYAPYGYRHEGDHEKANRRRNLKPVEQELKTIGRIYKMSLEGLSCQKIADRFNAEGIRFETGMGRPWNSAKVRNILICPAYAGLVQDSKGKLIRGLHWETRVIEPEQRALVLDGIAHRRKHVKGIMGAQQFRLFAGIIRCGECGHLLESNFSEPSPNYRCHRRSRKQGSGCKIYVSARSLETAIVAELQEISSSAPVLLEARRRIDEEVLGHAQALKCQLDETERAITGLASKRSRLLDRFMDDQIPKEAYREKDEEISAEIQRLEREALNYSQELAGSQDQELLRCRALEALTNLPLLWENLEDGQRREMLRHCVEGLSARHLDGCTILKLKLVGMAEKEVSVMRGRTRCLYDKPAGPEGLTPRQLAFLAHRKDKRKLREAAALMGVQESQGYRLRKQIYDWLEVKSDEAAVEICAAWIERNREVLPLYDSKSRKPGRHKRLQTMEFQMLCLVVEQGLTPEEIYARHGTPVEVVKAKLAGALTKAGRDDPSEALDEVRRLSLAPGKKPWQWGSRRRLVG